MHRNWSADTGFKWMVHRGAVRKVTDGALEWWSSSASSTMGTSVHARNQGEGSNFWTRLSTCILGPATVWKLLHKLWMLNSRVQEDGYVFLFCRYSQWFQAVQPSSPCACFRGSKIRFSRDMVGGHSSLYHKSFTHICTTSLLLRQKSVAWH